MELLLNIKVPWWEIEIVSSEELLGETIEIFWEGLDGRIAHYPPMRFLSAVCTSGTLKPRGSDAKGKAVILLFSTTSPRLARSLLEPYKGSVRSRKLSVYSWLSLRVTVDFPTLSIPVCRVLPSTQ